MLTDRYENRAQWQRIAQHLINAYAERFYRFVRGRWEAPYLEVGEIDARDMPAAGYTIETTGLARPEEEIRQIAELVESLRDTLRERLLASWNQWHGSWKTEPFAGHLYQPLLHVGSNAHIRISPVALSGRPL